MSGISPNSAATTGPNTATPAAQQGLEPQSGHYNRVTQRWEGENEHPAIDQRQNGSTMPEGMDDTKKEPSFIKQVIGKAKIMRGKATNSDHTVAAGQTLLEGHSLDQAHAVEDAVADAELQGKQGGKA